MRWIIYLNNIEINTIVADEDFVKEYCTENGYTYELIEGNAEESPKDPVDVLTEKVSTLESENTLLKAQLQATSDRSDFIEDCIAEMAAEVYV